MYTHGDGEVDELSGVKWRVIPGRLVGMDTPPMSVGNVMSVDRSISRLVGICIVCGMLKSVMSSRRAGGSVGEGVGTNIVVGRAYGDGDGELQSQRTHWKPVWMSFRDALGRLHDPAWRRVERMTSKSTWRLSGLD
jgi:hypothetical protein